MSPIGPQITISELANALGDFKKDFDDAKRRAAAPDFPWYPYDSLGNFIWLDRLLTGSSRDFRALVDDKPILDIGCADGATSFFLEKVGFKVEVIDHPLTSFNGMRGLRALKPALNSQIGINTVNLDAQFTLPRKHYGLILLLGLLYHLKNPYYVLEALSRHTRYCFLSTRVAKFAPGGERLLQDLPLAYLVAPDEMNNDATNFWIFSKSGLERLLARTGWRLREYLAVGDLENSDPSSPERDERAFCFLESQNSLIEPARSGRPSMKGFFSRFK